MKMIQLLKIIGGFLWFEVVFSAQCGVYYEAVFSDDIEECDGFINKMVDCSGLKLGTENHGDEDGGMCMQGSIILNSEIKHGFALEFEIWKESDIGSKEFINGALWDICRNLDSTESPWYPLLKSIGITECPFPTKEYIIEKLTISLDCVKDIMNHNFVGEYQVVLALVNDLEKMSCHVAKMSLLEKYNDDCSD